MPDIDLVPLPVERVVDVLGLGHSVFDTSLKPYTSWSLSAVAHHLDAIDSSCWAALDPAAEGRLAGFVLGSMGFDQRADWGNLEWIATDPAYRGQGLAHRLVERCCEQLVKAGATAVVTDVESRNTASATLMRGHGFREGATVTLFVRDTPQAATQAPDLH
ncbi:MULTISPECIES: GNAT family N-acetyltransferase [unclassified Streptomyces]|uniref:GNAT family N-acetyltransferase n=1 Tax=unclassified Streptomyces TaxID=2593676 RepID=UPI000DBA8267|nr:MULTISPECIES: GNAT family N-acetyltransferase [unclassified Streptomyces]MYT73482.1 GNAT family N-acetyltransferase [Streptomyces sp. SID8367]RAJ85014.1 acetyltransferase (GNAT) family protein [Streptomyces sp. PsTaAH-137]